jgi:hypothetical protein
MTIIKRSVGIPVAHGRVEHSTHIHAVPHAVVWHAHVQAGQVEASRSACSLDVIAHREVAVTVGIASRRSDVGRIDDICVDKSELHRVSNRLALGRETTHVFVQLLKPLRMALFDVLTPEVLALEKLCAFWDFAAPFRFVLLLDIP